MWSNLFPDVKAAFRAMRRRPAFTAVIVATLAIGIGANTAMFALVYAALLKPLPYKDPDRLVLARRTVDGRPLMWNSSPDYYDYQAQTAGFETLAACGSGAMKVTVTGGNRPERVDALMVSHDLFPMLGVTPVAGRLFRPDEGRAGAPRVMIINTRMAERRFGTAEAAVGQTLGVNGDVAATVVGVLPTSFRFLETAEMWAPIRRGENDGPETRRFHNWVLIGRLRPGVSMAAVQAQLDVVSRRLQQQYPETNKTKALRVDPLQATLLQNQTPRLMVLMGAVAVVLLIACANVAGLLLARGVSRRPELAVRTALGASRRRLLALLATESLLLSGMAGMLGVVLAIWLERLLPIAAGLGEVGVEASGLSAPVLFFALGAALATGVLSGVAPALRDSSLNMAAHLAPGTRATESRGGSRLRSVLVAGQVGLSLVLLVGAGLLVRSLAGLMTTPLGFDSTNLQATSLSVPYADEQKRVQFQEGLHDDLLAVPGITAVTFTSHMPFPEPFGDPPVWRADRPPLDSSQERTALARLVMPGYFTTLGMRLLSGRDLEPSDRLGTPAVMVVNEAFIRDFFPGENPVGQRVMVARGKEPLDCVVVGVVADARTEVLGPDPFPTFYLSANQMGLANLRVLLRSRLPAQQVEATIRKLVTARDGDIPVDPLVSMASLVSDSIVAPRVTTLTLTAFSLVALLLAALGLYGVLMHHVARRTHEIGVRLSLGASTGTIVRDVLRRSALMVAPGLAVGVLVALGSTRLVEGLLYGVPPTDPITFVAVTVSLALVALAASAWPAWRAARVDPVRALRAE